MNRKSRERGRKKRHQPSGPGKEWRAAWSGGPEV